ncbi:hypothetical protein G3I60_40955 [Streptomyces sp. SID13666]|uniref:hypothetical protein n=1 Tax=unclassified Streptomyces TaxID=2593676 RepID=UPI0013C2136F|nr:MULTISPECIES: hypothetical protein [unclassified Streptomyces]NEA60369.1 hypothetical protein [Streptomyces sp. SID13666]NEA76769.1 hypothetical protein [Streptomyces sp. SID13588]
MPDFTLRLAADQPTAEHKARSSFYWLADARSSFRGIPPTLHPLTAVPALNRDFVRVAATVLAADRSVLRAGRGSDWNQRRINLAVPVSAPDRWNQAAPELARVLAFLSGDHWTLTFHHDPPQQDAPRPDDPPQRPAPRRVVLLSGGADSAVGALRSRTELAEGESHILLSHFSNTMLPPIQKHVAEQAQALTPGPGQDHLTIHLGRGSKRIDGTPYPSESSTRTRSLLFLALGLAAAAPHRVPLWIPENGFASLNPPLGPERLGSLSTRTTHPRFLQDLSQTLASIGAHAAIENPFATSTKGEMFTWAIQLLGEERASAYLSATHSCSLVGQWTHGFGANRSCGVCFGCTLRRASFTASGIADRTAYIDPAADSAAAAWLARKSVRQPMRNFVQRGVTGRDLAAMSLPDTYLLREALDLCRRGIAELETLRP